ncbi:MAG: ABC transporter substrate-binding protein, partial [Campylobacterales bacterium]|nr:ABC transporter substrate-binding protein [Campylobacterales bacterium]
MRAIFFWLFFISFVEASTLHQTISGNAGRLNPLLATDTTSSTITSKIFVGLLKYDKHGNIIGELAEKYWWENDTTLFINLKKNRTWHDGKEITAEDVVFTYQTAINPKIFTPYSSSFRVVKSVEAKTKYQVKIKYKKPYFKALEVWMMDLIPKHILENEEDLMNSEFNKKPLGNGMYKLSKFEFGKDVEFVAYDGFKPHKAKIEKTILHYTQDPMAEFLMLKSRKIDIGSLKPIQVDRQLDKDFTKDYKIVKSPAFAYTYLGFNLKKKKFQDKRVREA